MIDAEDDVTEVPPQRALLASALAAPSAAVLFWMAADDIGLGQMFGSPFPWLLFALTWFVVLPVYARFHGWFGLNLPRFLLAALAAAALPTAKAVSYFLYPRNLFAAALINGVALAGAFAFWLCLRLAATHRRADQTGPAGSEDGPGGHATEDGDVTGRERWRRPT